MTTAKLSLSGSSALVMWAGLPSLEPGFSYSRATVTTTAIAEQGSELLLFILYDDISCRSEVTWVAFEVSELNEQ